MNPSQNELKMSRASREPCHTRGDGDATDWWLQLQGQWNELTDRAVFCKSLLQFATLVTRKRYNSRGGSYRIRNRRFPL